MLAYLGYEPPSKESLGAAPFSEFGDDNDSVIDFDVMSMTSSVASSIPRLFSPAGASAVADGDVDVDVDYDDADSVASKDSIASTIYRAYARDHPEDPTGSAKFADPAERRSVIRKYRAAERADTCAALPRPPRATPPARDESPEHGDESSPDTVLGTPGGLRIVPPLSPVAPTTAGARRRAPRRRRARRRAPSPIGLLDGASPDGASPPSPAVSLSPRYDFECTPLARAARQLSPGARRALARGPRRPRYA
ncbi:hypothetical protein SO694_00077116 [Aureococcus anophagefferens]|uniref:Uncharacterized protein n=1 Tax=Aureococcus anophagefferens TaxID=44056 RepID=A0ABR1FHS3_AURAN